MYIYITHTQYRERGKGRIPASEHRTVSATAAQSQLGNSVILADSLLLPIYIYTPSLSRYYNTHTYTLAFILCIVYCGSLSRREREIRAKRTQSAYNVYITHRRDTENKKAIEEEEEEKRTKIRIE